MAKVKKDKNIATKDSTIFEADIDAMDFSADKETGVVVIGNAQNTECAIEKNSISKDDIKKYRQMMFSIGDKKTSKDIYYMIRSRYKVLYIQSNEELRVIDYFRHMSLAEGFDLYTWDISRGMIDAHSKEKISTDEIVHEDPVAVLSYVIDIAKSDEAKIIENHGLGQGRIYMLLDFHSFINPYEPDPRIERKLKEFAETCSVCTIVIVAPVFNCPPSLEKTFTLIDFPYPSKKEIEKALKKIVKEVPMNFPKAKATAKKRQEEIVKAASGLTLVEAENAFAKTLVKHRDFLIPTILDEKKQIISKGRILEYRDPRFTMDHVGGLEYLKSWMKTRRNAFCDDAVEFGLPTPRGILILGIPGCVLQDTKIKIKKVSNKGKIPLFEQ